MIVRAMLKGKISAENESLDSKNSIRILNMKLEIQNMTTQVKSNVSSETPYVTEI